MINFIKKNKLEFFLITLIIFLALGLRLYRIDEFMTFLGDEGRDVRIVRDLITKGNLVFIGPQTSVGNMYLGPLYYYMMAPALLISGLNPIGPAVMNALLGAITVWLTWFVARKWFGKIPAFISALLYAISPVAIIYSRSSWNPNPMPFFALLSIWYIYEVWQNKKYQFIPLVGIFFACALQMHYLGLMLLPALGIFWLITLSGIIKTKNLATKNDYIKKTALAVFAFLLLMSPLFIFDLKHSGMNFNAFKAFFSDRQTTVNLNPATSDRFIPVINLMASDLVLARQTVYQGVASLLIVLLSIYIYFKSKWKNPLKIVFVWLGFALLGLGIYKQHVYIHYLGFIYPAIYLLVGAILGFFLSSKILLKVLSTIALVYLVVINIQFSPVLQTPNRQMQRTEQAVDSIIKESNGEPFNFGLIAKQNYDESYRYFFENKKANMHRGVDKKTDQLFVICEDGDKCQPEGSPNYEIAMFGQSHVMKEWTIDYLRLYKLTRFK